MLDSLRSGWITTGPKAKRFEKEFAAYVGARHALAVAHCTGALHLALFALGVGPGDEVITTPFTFTATAEVIGYLGARPVFVDIDPDTFNLDPARVEEALASGAHRRVRAILPVHFAGHACDMDRLLAIARSHNLKIVEDAAHAVGAARHLEGRGMTRIGTIGDLSCFSFYATKNITSAEGGMVTTEDDALAERIAVASLHGMNRDAWKRYDRSGSWFYEIHDTGFKYNLSDVHAAIGVAQLARADEFMRRRVAIARAYSEALRAEPALQVPTRGAGNRARLASLRPAATSRAAPSGPRAVRRASARARHRHLGALHPAQHDAFLPGALRLSHRRFSGRRRRVQPMPLAADLPLDERRRCRLRDRERAGPRARKPPLTPRPAAGQLPRAHAIL